MKYEILKDLLEQGHWVAVKDINDEWMVFTYLKPSGHVQGTYCAEDITECFEKGLTNSAIYSGDIEDKFTDEYVIVTKPPKLLKVGDRVRILENIREIVEERDWNEKKVSMIGKRNLIITAIEFDGSYSIRMEIGHTYTFPHWAVAPDYSKEQETINIGGTEYEVTKELKQALKNLKEIT